jgi:outer membrane translocation and assembly module TamA
MSSALTVLIGIGGLGTLAYFLFNWGSGGKANLIAKAHEIFQKKKIGEITGIEKKQNVVRTEIATKEKVSKETKKKIEDIQEKAAKEIEEVLKEDNVENIHKSITSDWEDI